MRKNEFTVELAKCFRIFAFNVSTHEHTIEEMDDERDVVVRDVDGDVEPTGVRIVANARLSLTDFRRLLNKCIEMMGTCTEEAWTETLAAARAEIEKERANADEPWL